MREKSILSPKSYYSKNKLITENKINKKFKNNSLILRPSNIIGDTEKSKRIHCTFIDIFQKNIQKLLILANFALFEIFEKPKFSKF